MEVMKAALRLAGTNTLAFVIFSALVGCQSSDPMVYVTEHGKKYHVKECRLKHGSSGIALSEAKAKGYEPCEVCKPPQ